jgi:hypothetical protein
MINTGYPDTGFEEMYPTTAPTPEWYGFGHKHLVYNQTPVRHLILVDGQQHSEIDVTDPDEPLDFHIAERLKDAPAGRPHIPVSNILTINPTVRPGARPGLETGQFEHPDTRPGVIARHFGRGR